MDYFSGQDLMIAFAALKQLYSAVVDTIPDSKDHGGVLCGDDVDEVEWTITCRPRRCVEANNGISPCVQWKVVWALISRSKLRPQKYHCDKGTARLDMHKKCPVPLFDVTAIIPGSIVYIQSDIETNPKYAVKAFLKDR